MILSDDTTVMKTDSNNLSNTTSKEDNDEIDLMALLFAILRGWKTVVFFAVLGLVIGVLYSRYVNPTFKSDALIQIDDNSNGVSAFGSDISALIGAEGSKAQTEAELIRSRMILEPVVNLLHLRIKLSDPNIGFMDRIKSDITSTQTNQPEGVSLKTKDGEVQISQFNVSPEYLNQPFTLTRSATGFVLSNGFEDFKGQIGQAHKFRGIDGQIHIIVNELPLNEHPVNVVKQSLAATISAINNAMFVAEKGQQTGIIEISMTGLDQRQVTSILKQIIVSYVDQNQSRGSEETKKTIEFMETQIPTLKRKLEESETIFNNFREKYGTIDVGKEAELLLNENSRIEAQFNELKLKKADLTTYYTEEHPLVVQINEQVKVLNTRRKEIDDTIAGLPEIQREFLTLSEDTAINREIYLNLLKNYEQLKIVRAGQIGDARIVDLPINTFNAVAPRKPLILLLALILGTILGVAVIVIRNSFRNVVKDPERIEGKTGVPVVATIPRSPLLTRLRKNNKAPNRLLAYVDNNSLSYEAIKSLRTNLMFGMPVQGRAGQRAKVILITGESPGVGKSFISANLTEVFAQLDKKVLIMDADMRLGELHRMFSMSQDNGLADYLSQDKTHLSKSNAQIAEVITSQETNNLESFIHPTGIDNIDFMPRGQHPRNPASLLANGSFNHLMAELNLHYDYILIDSPPVLAASDAMILAQHADKVLMVTRYDDSIEGQLVYAVNQMNKANIKVDGIILNDVQQGIMSKYSYHYSYAYGNNQ